MNSTWQEFSNVINTVKIVMQFNIHIYSSCFLEFQFQFPNDGQQHTDFFGPLAETLALLNVIIDEVYM